MDMKARWWTREGDGARCGLCFRGCLIPPSGRGYCGTRAWDGKTLSSPYLGRFSACAVDLIEKKPLRHWRPGTRIFSLGSVGCTMRCPFCQNHSIAQPRGCDISLAELPPRALLARVKQARLAAVAYTYNEPTLQAEYILEAAPLLKSEAVATVLVTNGMFSPDALRELAPHVDAANVDVKTFDPLTYSAMGGSLDSVKANVEYLICAGVHVELTHLVVPGISDSHEGFADMVAWIAGTSPDIPLHISRYFPAHNYSAPPTSVALMEEFAALARQKLTRVHLGNV